MDMGMTSAHEEAGVRHLPPCVSILAQRGPQSQDCLCCYSGCDPGGLLLLPEKGGPEGLDVGEVLAVMDMLQAAAAREVTSHQAPTLRAGLQSGVS